MASKYVLRCPECRTRRVDAHLMFLHTLKCTRPLCHCMGLPYPHRPGSGECFENPEAQMRRAVQLALPGQDVLDVVADVAFSIPGKPMRAWPFDRKPICHPTRSTPDPAAPFIAASTAAPRQASPGISARAAQFAHAQSASQRVTVNSSERTNLRRIPMRERDIEQHLVRRVKELGGEVRKVQWIGRRGAPDRLVMVPHASRAGRNSSIKTFFVELKAPGKKAEPHQAREHARMQRMGQNVVVIDSLDAVEALLA